MPYPDHYLATMGGTLRGDIWSVNVRLVPSDVLGADPLSPADQEAAAQRVYNAWKDTCSDPAVNVVSSAVVLQYGKFNRIAPDGSYADTGASHTYFGANYSTATAPIFTNQDSMVLSWVTAVERGPASKGRIFVPCPSGALTAATGIWSQAIREIGANFGAALINRLNNDPLVPVDVDLRCAVVSPLEGGVAHEITSVRVGSVPDTQRRRRNALVELYSVNSAAIV